MEDLPISCRAGILLPLLIKEAVLERMDNPLQKPYLQPLVDTIKNRSPNPEGQAKIAISLVQHLPYNAKRSFQQPAEWYLSLRNSIRQQRYGCRQIAPAGVPAEGTGV